MTDIKNPTTRRTREPFVRFGPDKKRIVVTLHPLGADDAITVRLERRREGHTIIISDLYALLVRKAVMNRQMEKVRSRIGKPKIRRVRRK